MQSTGMTPASVAGEDILEYTQHLPGHFAIPTEWEDV